MQYVLNDVEYAYVEELKKTLRSWELIFERFKLQFKDCPVTTVRKLQRCYSYKTAKIKKEQGVASSPNESGDLVTKSRKRKKESTKNREALIQNKSIEVPSSTDGAPSSTDGAPDETIYYPRQMIDALIAESDALLVRLEAETAQKKHFETELTASLTAYTDLFEDTQATIKQAVKDALDDYKTTELLKAMDQDERAAQVTSCDNP
jgi:hypothetical protein